MMKTKGKKRWEAIWELLRKPKRALSIVLSASMIAGGLQVAMPTITAQASQLDPYPVYSNISNGSGRRTAWSIPAKRYNGDVNDGFDLHGILLTSQYGGGKYNASNPTANIGTFKYGDTDQVTTTYRYQSGPQGQFNVFYRQLESSTANLKTAGQNPENPQDNYWRTKNQGNGTHVVNFAGNGKVSNLDQQGGGASGVQFRFTLHPSADGSLVLADYTLRNTDSNFHTVQIGTNADTYVGHDGGSGTSSAADTADVKMLEEPGIIHMVNVGASTPTGDGTPTYEVFDVICKDAGYNLGITSVDSFWAGPYYERNQDGHKYNVWPYHSDMGPGVDSGFAYSWNVYLRPHEEVTKRVAFSAQGASYYVNATSGNDGATGTYNAPLKTIQKAIDRIGNKLGYIYLQTNIDQPTPIAISGTQNVTIQSTDFKTDGTHVDAYHETKTLKYTGTADSLFKVSGGNLTITDLNMDGSETKDTAANVSGGTLTLTSKASLTGTSHAVDGKGSAIDITGGGVVEIQTAGKPAEVKSASGAKVKNRGLVNVTADHQLFIGGEQKISIKDAKDDAGISRNVYLAAGAKIHVTGQLEGEIGVTTADLPDAHVEGDYSATMQRVVAVSDASTSVPHASFTPDMSGLESAQGIPVHPGNDPSANSVVFRREGNKISYEFVDENGRKLLTAATAGHPAAMPATTMEGATLTGSWDDGSASYSANGTKDSKLYIGAPLANFTAGASVKLGVSWTVPAAADQVPYTFKEVKIQGASWTAASDGSIGTSAAPVTMPNSGVSISYVYAVKKVKATFHMNGGTYNGSTGDVIMQGDAGSNFFGFPSPSKPASTGENFLGWATTPTATAPNALTAASNKYPAQDTDYYAVYQLDTTTQHGFNVDYANSDGSIIFRTLNRVLAPYNGTIQAGYYPAHGYNFSQTGTNVQPADRASTTAANTAPFTNGFNPGHDFQSSMGTQDVTLHYVYTVGTDPNNDTSKFIVHYVNDDNGTEFRTAAATKHFPEESFTITAPTFRGYDFVNGFKKAGFILNPDPATTPGIPTTISDP